MTTTDLQSEHRYRYEERLGMLCGGDKPTPEQERIATTEANEAVEALSKVIYRNAMVEHGEHALKLSPEETQATKSENQL